MNVFYNIIAVIVLTGIAVLVIVGVTALCVQMLTGWSLDGLVCELKEKRRDSENKKWYDIGRYCERYGAKAYRERYGFLGAYVLERSNGVKGHYTMHALINEVRYSLDNEKRAGG
jgi:hypothetical protein